MKISNVSDCVVEEAYRLQTPSKSIIGLLSLRKYRSAARKVSAARALVRSPPRGARTCRGSRYIAVQLIILPKLSVAHLCLYSGLPFQAVLANGKGNSGQLTSQHSLNAYAVRKEPCFLHAGSSTAGLRRESGELGIWAPAQTFSCCSLLCFGCDCLFD